MCSATSCATSVGVVPTRMPRASTASFFAAAVADDRVTADSNDRRVAEPELRELVPDLVRERARARHEADRAFAEDLSRDDPDVRLSRREHTRAVRPDHRHALRTEICIGAEHLM